MADILVNQQKAERAQEILDLVSGKKVARDDGEKERQERFTAHLASAEVDPKSPGALLHVYKLLGGLVRSPAEHKEAEAKKARLKKSKKIVVE